MPPTRPSLAARFDQAAEQLGWGLLDSTPEDCSATFAVNALHAVHAIRCAVPHFKRSGAGAVVRLP
jgi:3-oxoacyl-[acyl-carrier protein] reductase